MGRKKLRRQIIRDEQGSVLLLGLGFIAVILMAISVATDAALAVTQRSTLQARADAAVLAGVQAIDLDTYYLHGATAATALVPATARAQAITHLQRTQSSNDIPGMEIVSVVATNHTVEAVLRAPVRTAFWPIDARISVASRAHLDYVG